MAEHKQRTETIMFFCALLVLLLAGGIYLATHRAPAPPVVDKTAGEKSGKPGDEPAAGRFDLGHPLKASKRNPFDSPLAQPTPQTPPVGPRPGPGSTPPAPIGPASPPPVAAADFVVTGIMDSDGLRQATLKQGEKTFIVGVGESLEGGYSVKAITSDRVILAKGRERFTLKMGGG
jgi:hypothetical protein